MCVGVTTHESETAAHMDAWTHAPDSGRLPRLGVVHGGPVGVLAKRSAFQITLRGFPVSIRNAFHHPFNFLFCDAVPQTDSIFHVRESIFARWSKR